MAEILDLVAQGANVTITKHGVPFAIICRVGNPEFPTPGYAKKDGWDAWTSEDFNVTPDEFKEYLPSRS
jgi:antitoxin (DNA-binding transcriptional repressor) of toxin-antitoxin stability system